MNAVDVVERLTVLGRRMQARERLLQQPVVPLHSFPLWEQVLADPLLLLETLLAVTGSASHSPATTARPRISRPPVHSPAFVPMPMQPQEQPGGEPDIRVGRSPIHPPTPSPGTGVRLVRQQSSLLGILIANLNEHRPAGPADFPGVGAAERRYVGVQDPHGRVQATQWREHSAQSWEGGSRQGAGHIQASSEDATNAALDRTDRSPLLPPGMFEPVGLDTAGDGFIRRSKLPDAGATVQLGAAPMPAALHTAGPEDGSTGVGMFMNAQAVDTRFLGQSNINSRPALAETRSFETDIAGQGPGGLLLWDRSTPVSVDPPLDDRGWRSSPDGAGAERPLSLAQIDQVLAALDERLELLVLRMYGTSGSR